MKHWPAPPLRHVPSFSRRPSSRSAADRRAREDHRELIPAALPPLSGSPHLVQTIESHDAHSRCRVLRRRRRLAGFSVYIDSLQRANDHESSGGGYRFLRKSGGAERRQLAERPCDADRDGGRTLRSVADEAAIQGVLKNDVLTGEFISTYVATRAAGSLIWPDSKMPDGYDPRQRPWYQQAVKADARVLTETLCRRVERRP